jgi:hypothetical protein
MRISPLSVDLDRLLGGEVAYVGAPGRQPRRVRATSAFVESTLASPHRVELEDGAVIVIDASGIFEGPSHYLVYGRADLDDHVSGIESSAPTRIIMDALGPSTVLDQLSDGEYTIVLRPINEALRHL